jgi:uncharacterized protein (DUF362 family)
MAVAPRIFLHDLADGYAPGVAEGLRFAGFFDAVPAGGTVFLKPNLTFPEYRPGVMTSVECVRAAAECLLERGYRLILGEADSGGYNRFSMDAVFEKIGLKQFAAEKGIRLVNLSFTEPEVLDLRAGLRRIRVPVPRLLLQEIDAFISLAVPKLHVNTRVSLSIKNQWGCIQEPGVRLRLHPYFAPVMYEVNRRLPRTHAIIDGRFGLNRSGPMRGDPVPLNWLLVANDLVAADRTCCRLMQVDEAKVGYLQHFRRQGWWGDFGAVTFNRDWEPFKKEAFRLSRQWTDLPGLACFNNAFLAWLGYHSPLAGFAHWLLYLFREPFYDYDKEQQTVRTDQQRRKG